MAHRCEITKEAGDWPFRYIVRLYRREEDAYPWCLVVGVAVTLRGARHIARRELKHRRRNKPYSPIEVIR